MDIGLINDLAVGCAGMAVSLKSMPLFSHGAYVGAHGSWAERGQNWGYRIRPPKTQYRSFAFYRSLIHANMEDVGGLKLICYGYTQIMVVFETKDNKMVVMFITHLNIFLPF